MTKILTHQETKTWLKDDAFRNRVISELNQKAESGTVLIVQSESGYVFKTWKKE